MPFQRCLINCTDHGFVTTKTDVTDSDAKLLSQISNIIKPWALHCILQF